MFCIRLQSSCFKANVFISSFVTFHVHLLYVTFLGMNTVLSLIPGRYIVGPTLDLSNWQCICLTKGLLHNLVVAYHTIICHNQIPACIHRCQGSHFSKLCAVCLQNMISKYQMYLEALYKLETAQNGRIQMILKHHFLLNKVFHVSWVMFLI